MKIFSQYSATAFVLFTLFLVTSCQSNQLDVDISDIKVDLKIKRFEDDLFGNQLKTIQEFKSKYPYFLDDFAYGIIGLNARNDEELFNHLMTIRSKKEFIELNNLIHEKYGNFKQYEDELNLAYRYFKYHFPKENIPEIITFNALLNFYPNPIGDNYIGIALDLHMGPNFKHYDYVNFEKYWRKTFIPQNIVTNHMLAQANDLFVKYNKDRNCLDNMIYYGKLLYFLDATTPNVPDYIKIGLTKEEFEWCQKEEKMIWEFIVKEKYIYETEKRNYERLLKEGPTTLAPGVPEDCPAMIGKYAGWMMVRKYMNENSKITLKDLMTDSNSDGILKKSNYKP